MHHQVPFVLQSPLWHPVSCCFLYSNSPLTAQDIPPPDTRVASPLQDSMWAASERGDLPSYRSVMSKVKVIPAERAHGQPVSIPVRVLIRLNNGLSPGRINHLVSTSLTSACCCHGAWATRHATLAPPSLMLGLHQ
jgi:hypothetical protein